MNEFFAMGGYGHFVWPSYALALVILIAHVVVPLRYRRQLIADIQRRLRREARAAAKTSAGSDS